MKLKPWPAYSHISAGVLATLNIPARCGLSGHFTMTVSGGKRGTVELAAFDNLILDAGLEYLASGGMQATANCQVGTGTTAVSAGQTALANRIASSATYQRNFGTSGTFVAGPPAYKSDYITYRFATGVATGNLTEVGVGWASSGSLFSRALIVDGGGSPTSITVLADETLDVTYTLRAYAPADVTGSVVLAGTTHAFTMRAANMSSSGNVGWHPGNIVKAGFANRTIAVAFAYSGGIGAPGTTPTGTFASSSAPCTVSSYVPGSLQRSVEYLWDLNDGNVAGDTQSIYIEVHGAAGYASHGFQAEFTPKIPKNNTKKLRLNFTFTVARGP